MRDVKGEEIKVVQKAHTFFNKNLEWLEIKSLISFLVKHIFGILSEAIVFTLFSLFLLHWSTTEEYTVKVVDVISESIGINSFFITFSLIIFILPILLWTIGPRITEDCKNGVDEWLDNKYRPQYYGDELDKRKSCFIKKNKIGYKYFFLPIHNFNISFGIGSLGVMLALIIYQGDSSCVSHLVAFSMLFCVVFMAKLVAHASLFSFVISNLDSKIYLYKVVVTFISAAFVIATLDQLDVMFTVNTKELNEVKAKEEQCLILKDYWNSSDIN